MAVTPQTALPNNIVDGDDFLAVPVMADFNILKANLNGHTHTEYAVKGQIAVNDLNFDIGTQAELDAHIVDTTAIHGIADTTQLVLTNDARLTNTRTPTDNTVTSAKIVDGTIQIGDLAYVPVQSDIGYSLVSTSVLRSRVTSDINPRFELDADGKLQWGPGNAVLDTFLYRGGPGLIQFDGEIRAKTATTAFGVIQTGDSNERFNIQGTGFIQWGPGNAGQDTTLSRTATGQLQLSNRLSITNASNSTAFSTIVSGDTNSRYVINHDGTLQWGPGNAVQDVTLGRTGVNILQLGTSAQSGRLLVIGSGVGAVVYSGRVTTDTNDRYNVSGDGKNQWGPGNTTIDTNLYRSAVGTLQTDGLLIVRGPSVSAVADVFKVSAGQVTSVGFHVVGQVNNNVNLQLKLSGGSLLVWKVSGDNGKTEWADPATGTIDTNLYRSAAGVLKSDGALELGVAADTSARLIIRGGAGGNSMISLQRTSGSTVTYSWALAAGGLSFTDDVAGFTTGNMFGDASQNQFYIGQRGKISADTREAYLSGTTFAVGAGNDVGGAHLNIQAGFGTGAGTPGDLVFRTGTTVASGNTQTSNVRVRIAGQTGIVTLLATGKTALSLSDATTTTGLTIGVDTNLYRSSANLLRTDDSLQVGINYSQVSGVGAAFVNIAGNLTDTAAGAVPGMTVTANINPIAASATDFRSLTMSATIALGNTIDFSSFIKGAHLETRWMGTGNVTGSLVGALGQVVIPASGVNFGTITLAVGLQTGFAEFATVPLTGTVTQAIGLLVPTPTKTSAGLTVTTAVGVDVQAHGIGTTSIGIRIAKGNTYTLQLSGVDGTPASGITFGTDTNLYRSAADRLATDDLIIASNMGLATKQKAGTPVDADWAAAPPNGTIIIDSTGSKIWARVGGVWKSAALV